MGWNPVKKAQDKVKDAAIKSDPLQNNTNSNWNPTQTFAESTKGGPKDFLAGEQGAFNNAMSDIGNAYHTSIVDPLKNAGADAKNILGSIASKAESMYKDAYNGLGVPGGPGGMGGGGGMPMVSAPTMPGAGGLPGIAGAMPGMAAPANDPFRAGQTQLLAQLQAQAAGTGPSIAQNQLKMGQEQALANNIAMANSARGGANPLAARAALQQNAQQSGAMAMEAANLRLAEQQQAQGLLGNVAGAGRQGDLGQQQLAQQGAIAQQDLAAKYAQMGMTAQQANQQAAIDLAKMQQDAGLGWANLGLQSQIAQNALLGNTLQGAGGVMAGLGTMFSDKNLKKNIKSADKEIKKFLDTIETGTYEYKNKAHGEGQFTSPMAQSLQKSKLGKQMVEKKPEGLAVNYGANLGLILAAQAHLNKRLEKLETK